MKALSVARPRPSWLMRQPACSKATLAVCYQVDELVKHFEVSNSKAEFQQLVKSCGAHYRFVMEATGTYNLALAYYLHEQGGQVAVLNPLVIKRFIQMHLSKGKSDRKDAQWLLRYGQQPVKVWQPDETVLVECRQLKQVNEQLLKQKNHGQQFPGSIATPTGYQ